MTNTSSDPGPRWARTWWWLIVATISRGCLVFVLALAACALAPMVTGLMGSVVLSGSMMPVIRTGDVVLVRTLPADAPIPMGRVITFPAPASSGTTRVVMHRLVGVNPDGSLVTKGDANALPDTSSLARNDIIGQGAILIPWIGLPALWLTTGAYWLFALWILVTALMVVLEVLAPLTESQIRRRGPVPLGPWPADTHRLRARALRSKVRRAAVKPLVHVLILLVVVGAVSGWASAQVNARFSSQTTNVGNSWSVKAAATAVRLVFSTNPSGSTGGIPFPTQAKVTFQDASGHTTTSGGSVTLTITSPGGATLICAANPVASAAGVSSFSGCAINKAGTYTLRATSGSLTPAISSSFVIARGPAVALQFTTSPTATTANVTFVTAPVVSVLDAGGNTVSSTALVTISLTTAGGATLTCGTNPQIAVAGLDTFRGCRVSLPGTFSLTARSGGLATATSSSFVIGGPALALLTCQDQTWMATFSWTPTPYLPTTYTLYVNGIQVQATGADGWNSYVQLSSNNVPASTFPQGTATLEVRRVTSGGTEVVIGDGTVVLGSAGTRTYTCH